MNHSEQEFFVFGHYPVPVNDGTMDGMETAYNLQPASGSQSIACPICLRMTQIPVRHDCGHVLCWSCMQQSLSSLGDCPLCHALHVFRSGTRNTIPAPEDVSDADIERRFTPESVLDNDEYFATYPPQDASARRALKIKIIVRRPQVNLTSNRAGRRQEQDVTELNRRNVIYFVRLAPLTVKVGRRQWMASPAGNFFSDIEGADDVYQYRNKYAAKYGFTTTMVATRFYNLRSQLHDKGFPEEGYSPFYALCIDGLPEDNLLLQHMESGIHSGAADLVSFVRGFMSNPDLVERYQNDWPLNDELGYEFYWDPSKGKEGYITPPPYKSERPCPLKKLIPNF